MVEQPQAAPPMEFSRADDFASVYANNVQFELSVWDFKLIFGEIDQRTGKVAVEQHTSVTLPWLQAKLFQFYLQVNLAVFEVQNGKIKVPKELLPPLPPLPEELANNPQMKSAFDLIKKLHEEFIASL